MRKDIVVIVLVFFTINGLLFGQSPDFSGVLDSTINYTAGAGEAPSHSWGIEEYANIRLRFRPSDKTTLYAAVNFIAMSGTYAQSAVQLSAGQSGVTQGENYAAALELERLYFRINGDLFDTEAGLLRMNFGYGQVWGPMDFLNPSNPLLPNARPRGVLGANVSFYSTDFLKIMFFAAAPNNPLESGGGGFIPGLSLEQHWDKLSLQALYAYETPFPEGKLDSDGSRLQGSESKWGLHRFGLSFKADLILSVIADALYILNPDKLDGIEGLSASAGFEHSFLGGDLYFLFEYLFNGYSSISAHEASTGTGWKNRHYLYGSALYKFSDYCYLTLATLFCFDDLSFQPIVSFDYEFFQGLSMNILVRIPLDMKSFSSGKAGELGPIPPGYYETGDPAIGARFIVYAGVKLRF